MAYIESHQELRDHPKVKRMARMLDVPVVAVIGHLQCLWWWAMDYAQDGDTSRYDAHDLADASLWDGDPDLLVTALRDCGPGGTSGFLDGDQLHDWDQYGGKLAAKRRKDRERKREARSGQSTGRPAPPPPHVNGTSNGRPADVQGMSQVEERRGEERRELHGDADASADAPPDDEPPREATGGWTYSRTLAEWAVANGHDPPDTGDNRTELTRWLLGLIRPAPDATAEQLKTARGLGRTIVVDYLTHATGTAPPNEFWGYLGRLIATSGVDAVFDAVVVAVESGAGLTPPHNDNPLSLLKYATAVKNRSSR